MSRKFLAWGHKKRLRNESQIFTHLSWNENVPSSMLAALPGVKVSSMSARGRRNVRVSATLAPSHDLKPVSDIPVPFSAAVKRSN